MEAFLDHLQTAARRIPAFQRLAIISRILLALAFIPTGMVKVLGNRFTTMSTDTPIGAFFEAMYQTGVYWHFMGLGQVVAGVLLLVPFTQTLAAVMFLPIILNITVVTWALDFTGTKYITVLMLLANVFLLCWDYDRLKHLVFAPRERPAVAPPAPIPAIERVGYVLGTVSALIVLAAIRNLAPPSIAIWMLGAGGVAILLVLAGWIRAGRGEPVTVTRTG